MSIGTAERIRRAQAGASESSVRAQSPDSVQPNPVRPCTECKDSKAFDRACCFSCNTVMLNALQEKYSDLMREATEIKTTKSKCNKKVQRVEKSGQRNDQVEATPLTSGGTADIQNNNKLVCTVINGMCQMSQGTITFDLVIHSEFHEKFELIKDMWCWTHRTR